MSSDLANLRIDRSLKGAQPRRRHWIWWGLALLVLAGVGVVAGRGRSSGAIVDVMTVQASAPVGEDGIVLNATGYIIAAHKIELAPKVMGRVMWVGVERADKVEKGQVLVRLEDDEFRARQMQAQGQLDAARARLAELENGSRPEEIEKAAADLDAAKADMENAKAKLERTKQLVNTRAVAAQDLDDAQFRYNSQVARLLSLQRAYELTRKGPRVEQIAAQKAMVAQVEGTMLLAQTDLANTVIKAPVTGTILARNVEVGEYVTTGFVGEGGAKGFVVSIADLNELRVELDVSQDDFAKIRSEQKCWVTTDAYPDRKYEGAVDLISPEANRQKATVQVRVKILKPDELLRPEMNASVAFRASPGAAKDAPAIIVPASAVKDGNVFVMAGDRVQQRKVVTGAMTSKGVQISSGLVAGDELIVSPPDGLKDGEAVQKRK
jgi:HlyD family secretion protein